MQEWIKKNEINYSLQENEKNHKILQKDAKGNQEVDTTSQENKILQEIFDIMLEVTKHKQLNYLPSTFGDNSTPNIGSKTIKLTKEDLTPNIWDKILAKIEPILRFFSPIYLEIKQLEESKKKVDWVEKIKKNENILQQR